MITKEGAKGILRCIFAKSITSGKIRLCKNNPAPADADLVIGDLTEADFDGYAEVDISVPSWPSPVTNVSNEAESDGPEISFIAGGGLVAAQTCYGVYVALDDGGGEFLFAFGRFSPGKVVSAPTDTIKVTLNWFAWNGTP